MVFQIFVYDCPCKTITLDVKNTTYIKDIIPIISEKMNIPSKLFYLKFKKEYLNNDKQIKDYNIKKEDTIYFRLKFRI